MIRKKYQALFATIALLVCLPVTQAATLPTADYDFGLLPNGFDGLSDEINLPLPGVGPGDPLPPDFRPVSWFSFQLDSSAIVTLDTEDAWKSPNDTDTIIALYDAITGLSTFEQNDDCFLNSGYSCITASLSAGSYIIGITDWALYDPNDAPFSAGWMVATTDNIDDSYTSVNIQVSAVPVPAAVWLFGTALVGFVGMSRRRSIKA